ncbi:hypothetical protein [Pendulispora albinea]|uniref:Uncharacterized protein n=1 Tax=Pendulispora albinea TaxID=2741071 RepID=A0ABZ2MBJ4_9BACT
MNLMHFANFGAVGSSLKVAALAAVAATLGLSACAAQSDSPEGQSPAADEKTAAASSQQNVEAAAAPCWQSGGKWWCNNRVPTYLYQNDARVDQLNTNPSWFYCRKEAGSSGGGPHPNRWIKTIGDVAGVVGYARDIDIASETNSLPVCNE